MRNRYLLASFSDDLKKGSSYDVTLRIVRPTLPIERLWAYRQGNELQLKTRNDAEALAEGRIIDNTNYPSLNSKLYRLPKYTELTPVFNNPKLEFDKDLPMVDKSFFSLETNMESLTQKIVTVTL